MSLEIHPADPTDASALTELFYAAFTGPFNERMFPRAPDVTEWWEKNFHDSIAGSIAGTSNEVNLKVTSGSTIVAFARWKVPGADQDRHEEVEVNWAPSCDKELCERFFSGMESQHRVLLGGRRHYYLDMLGVHPSQKGRGLGSKLLKWGLERADAEGLEVYLSASPEGRPMYEKYGFRVVDVLVPCPGYEQAAMLRAPYGR
ncbi:uncharacterized protein N7515_008765 [Penicillium bovifimosum]|uniref:N-acetyltransferase domain-containing protein n=1 Tax=Penicillium bovifimosum TaxID=126998 RepID=A0A9W9GNJ2_9EURO|nr:uncharacterized protein N7515_008765 [Penicillium bovifimosum]KAJ5124940.1 hypothetical protein N7515_008765 [Penicillium bovifimosum]